MINQVELTCHIFSQVGNIYLRSESRLISIPNLFVPARSPIGGLNINSKLVDIDGTGNEDVYLEYTMAELNNLISSSQGETPLPIQAAYQAYLDELTLDGVALPPSDVQTLQNRVVYDLQSVWSKIDVLRLFATNYLTTSAASLYNIKNPSAQLATTLGTMTYSYGGWRGNAVDGYINQNWNPGAGGFNFSLNSAYEGVYVSKGFVTASKDLLTGYASATTTQMRNSSSTSQRLNSSGSVTGAVDLSGIGFKAINRASSAGLELYADLTQSTRTITSLSLANENKLLLRQGTAYGDAEIGAYVAGGAMSQAEHEIIRNAINNYITGIYLLNYSDETPINLYIIAGQSNAAGRGDNTEISVELDGLVGAEVFHLLPTPPSVIDETSNWQELELGVNNTTEQLGLQHGIEMRFGYEMHQDNPNTWIVKLGAGNTSMSSQWNATGSLFTNLVNTVLLRYALPHIRETIRRPVVLRGFVFIQGESDCVGGLGAAYQASYMTMVKTFIDRMNNAGYKTNKLRWFDWLVKNNGSAGYTTTDFNNVIAGKQYVMNSFVADNPTYSTKIAGLTFSDPAAIPFNGGDNQHYSAAGLDTMGQTTYTYFSQYVNE